MLCPMHPELPGRAEHFVQRCQQMATYDVVLLRFNLEAGMLLRDFLNGRQQRRQVLDIAGIRGNSVKQRFTLIAITLVTHVEDFFQLWVMRKHAIVEMGGQLRPVSTSRGMVAFTVAMVCASSIRSSFI